MVDVMPALLCFELKAAGVISSNEGEANCKTVLNSIGKALPTSPTTCTIFAWRKLWSIVVSSPLSAYLLRAAEPRSSMLKCGATRRIINALSNSSLLPLWRGDGGQSTCSVNCVPRGIDEPSRTC